MANSRNFCPRRHGGVVVRAVGGAADAGGGGAGQGLLQGESSGQDRASVDLKVVF